MKLKPLVRMMAMLPAMALPGTTALHASDLTIYKPNSAGKTSILLMLDTSGSMGISSLVLPRNNEYGSPGDVDASLCTPTEVTESSVSFKEWAYNAKPSGSSLTSFKKTVSINGQTIDYYLRGCGTASIDNKGKLVESATGKFDRLSRLKDAVIQLLADQSLDNQVRIGLGHFSTKTEINVGTTQNKLVDGHSGKILVPVAELTADQREKLIRALASIKSVDTISNEDGTSNSNLKLTSTSYPNIFKASSGTPAAHAYAEAGAYMMGTTTGQYPGTLPSNTTILYDGYSVIKNNKSTDPDYKKQLYYVCVGLDGNTGTALGATSMFCDNEWNRGMDKDGVFYDSVTKGPGAKVVNGKDASVKIYEPNDQGGWNLVTPQQFITRFGAANSVWELHKKLPIGWRWGGWLKVEHEPLDIEPIGAKVWDHHSSDTKNMVSYRSSPFSLEADRNKVPVENMVGSFVYANSTLKNGNNYKAGGLEGECNGNGIYFLTDGAPNSTKDNMAQTIMNLTLGGSYSFASKPTTNQLVSPRLLASVFAGETGGWEYIGEYAKKLRNRTANSNTQKNPANMNIKTAVVGFGASFSGLTKNSDGTYNCASAPNDDAKNACLWGSQAYGDGGFYYAENSEDIKNSIIKFVTAVTVGFTPSSLGSISVPRDPLDQTKYMTQGFFPMVMPTEDTTLRTWAGNLKKYNIVGGTLKDSSGNAIYKLENNQQVINSSAKDLWSNATAAGTDHSLINSGGAWNKIPVPSTAQAAVDAISNINSERKVYILDGSSLKKVTTQNLATNFTGTSALTGSYTVNQRLALLNYLGYKTTFPATTTQTTLTDSEIAPLALKPVSPYRFLGGVVHSTPLMVTKESTVSSNNAVGTREEYTVYGSMDGGLHIVNSSTGKEQSVFVPQEILSNQYDTLANGDSKGVGSLTGIAYGVDAPWVADNTFKVQTTTSNGTATTKYIANKINIYGGLRMGGKVLYGLNIIDPTSPELLFQIKPTTTNEFQRMAQIWSKPTVAEIRVKGERKKVLIFGGGYDADVYEKPAASFTEPSSTYGNALYVVDATTGALIWMSSSDTSGITESYKKTTQGDLKYSVVGQPVVRDYDADGLADMIYFADLGGQIFRVDLNNNNQMSKTTDTNIAVRVQTLAKLRTTDTIPFVPRFYDRLSTAVFDDGQNRFVLVTAGSGNRSFPLEEEVGGKNKVYGLIDRDAAANGLEKSTFVPASVITPSVLSNTGILGKTVTKQIADTEIAKMKLTTGSNMLRGWSFELRSADSGNYARAFEESQLIAGDLYVSLYDPKATLTGTANACGGGVTGISTTHRICMPYGDCAAYVKTSYQGINGPAFGVVSSSDPRTTSLVAPIAETREACVGNCPSANTTLTDKDLPKYSQVRKIKPVRWFEW